MLLSCGFILTRNSADKHRVRNAVLINDFVKNATLIRGQRLFMDSANIQVNTVTTFHTVKNISFKILVI